MSSGGGLGRLDNLRSTLGREKPRTRQAEEQTEPRRANGTKDEARQEGQEPRSTRTAGARGAKTDAKAKGAQLRSDGARKKAGTDTPRQQRGGGGTIRITVDLPGDQHGFLKTFVARSGSDGMSVVRALLSELERDEKLASRVSEKLVEERLRRQAQLG